MALPVTDAADQASKQIQVTPNMVLKIDGYDQLFGSAQIYKYIRIGDPNLFVGDDWIIGGYSLIDKQSPYFSFNSGATTKITQKLDPSRAQGSSVSSMVVALVDKNEEISELVTPGKILPDLLGRRATVYMGFKDTAWPEDYNIIFQGFFTSYESGAGTINLILSNPEEKKRSPVFNRKTAKLTSNCNFRSVQFQDIFYQNRDDVTNLVTVTYTAGGVAGSEVVTAVGTNIFVQIQNGFSTAAQIKKAIENSPISNQLVDAKIKGNSGNTQSIGAVTLSQDLVVNVDDTQFFSNEVPSEGFETYLKIDEELLKYTGKTSTSFTGCSRAQLYSSGALHDTNTDAESVYRLRGNGIDLALKTMLSGGPAFYLENYALASIINFDPISTIDDAIFFNEDIEKEYGVAVGDKVTITGATNPANNVTDSIVLEIGLTDLGTYLILSDNFVPELVTGATVKIKSAWNVWPIGMKLLPREIDIAQHLFVRDTFLPTFELDVFVKDVTNGKDFVEQQLYLPMACFSVPRKGRSSVAYHVGPLPNYEVVTLDDKSVTNPGALKLIRSTSEQFANEVNYQLDYDPVTDKFLRVLPYIDQVSKDKIPIGDKAISIESYGLRTTSNADQLTAQAANRLIRRYSNGAEFIKGINVRFGTAFKIEIGDIVAVDFKALQITDLLSGTRAGEIKLMEVQNKVIDNKTGQITVDVVNTTFGTGDRFGLISPSSEVTTGSTTTKIKLLKSWSTKSFQKESSKWRNYIGQKVLVHSEDWTVSGETTIVGFDDNSPQGMIVSPALSFTPQAGYIVQIPNFPSTPNQNDLVFYKLRHAFFSPQVPIVSASSRTVFDVSALDAARFFVGSQVRVHNYSYTEDAPEAVVTDITGTTITIDTPTGFVITASHYVDLIGFPDKSNAYRII